MHDHDFFECFVVESGIGTHLIDGSQRSLAVGELHFIRPEHCHGFRTSGEKRLLMTNVAIESSVLNAFIRLCPLPKGVWGVGVDPNIKQLNLSQKARFLNLTREITHSQRNQLDAYFFLVGILRIIRPSHNAPGNANLPDWLREALPLAAEPENLREGVAGLVKLCGRSPEHVARLFQQHLGQTPTTWISTARLHLARRFLETSHLSVIEVALECGFGNLSHFHKLFKADTGLTPLQYRKQTMQMPLVGKDDA